MTTDPFELAAAAAAYIGGQTGVQNHDVALVLGSGWSGAAELIGETTHTLEARSVPGFSATAVEGHVGTIRSVLTADGTRVLVLGARTITRVTAFVPSCMACTRLRRPARRRCC